MTDPVVFDLDGVTITDSKDRFRIVDGFGAVYIPRKTFLQIIGGDLWDRLASPDTTPLRRDDDEESARRYLLASGGVPPDRPREHTSHAAGNAGCPACIHAMTADDDVTPEIGRRVRQQAIEDAQRLLASTDTTRCAYRDGAGRECRLRRESAIHQTDHANIEVRTAAHPFASPDTTAEKP